MGKINCNITEILIFTYLSGGTDKICLTTDMKSSMNGPGESLYLVLVFYTPNGKALEYIKEHFSCEGIEITMKIMNSHDEE